MRASKRVESVPRGERFPIPRAEESAAYGGDGVTHLHSVAVLEPQDASLPDWSNPRLFLLQRRRVHQTLREVYRLDTEQIIKRFVIAGPGPHDRRRVWHREDRALRHLRGLATPRSFGYRIFPVVGGREVVLRREYIAGTWIERVDGPLLEEAALLIAEMHAQGVTNNDLDIRNFLRGEDGRLWLLDFGRARVFLWPSPLMWYGIGRDIARFARASMDGDSLQLEYFLDAYKRRAGEVGLSHVLLDATLRWHRRRYGI